MTDTTLPTAEQVQSWPGLQVKDSAGTAIGTVRSVYGDDSTGLPEWIEVGLADDGLAYVPVLGTEVGEQELRVAHSADRIAGAPRFASDAKLEVDDERQLYDHYGIQASQELSDTLLPAAADLPGEPAAEPVAAPAPAPTPTASPAPRAEPAPVAATPPAPLPPPAPAAPAPSYEQSSSKARPAALLLAVPAALLLARTLRRRSSPTPQDHARRAAPGAALLVPVGAGALAAVLQRRTRRQQQHPAETSTTLTGPVVVGAASVPADRT